jgi:hypothetical protein
MSRPTLPGTKLTKFGIFTSKLRESTNEDKNEMADRLGIPVVQLSQAEYGRQLPPLWWAGIFHKKYNLSNKEYSEMVLGMAESLRTYLYVDRLSHDRQLKAIRYICDLYKEEIDGTENK